MPANVVGRGCGCVLLVWLLVWTLPVVVFDGVLGWTLARQTWALTFPRADGVVTHSGVRAERDDEGDLSYRLDIAYDYEVAGRRHTGTRYSYGEMGTNTSAWKRVSAKYPVGARVRVAYDPADPDESLLKPGLTGFHVAMVWFLTPFNVIMVGGWVYLVRGRRPAFDPADRRSVAPTVTGWRVRVPGVDRARVFGGCLLGVTFAGMFVWGCGCGFNPAVWIAGTAYVVAVALAAWFARRRTPWFEVDETARVLRLPADVPFAAVRAVVVTRDETRDSEGDVTESYHCELIRAGAPPVRVATFSDRDPADALAAWLRERIRAAAP